MKFLKEKDGMTICENIPKRFLKIQDTSFNQTNSRFKRMLKASGISPLRLSILRAGVNFNIGWLWSKQELNIDDIYKEEI